MYAFINGIVEETDENGVVLEVNGIGYYIQCPMNVLSSVAVGEKKKIYTYQHVREDAIILYGFLTKEDRIMFLRLITVSGIGPKIALQVLSALSAKELALVLVSGDTSALTSVPGIGKKTAQRMILELREKVDNEELEGISAVKSAVNKNSSIINDAIYALAALGYSAQEVRGSVEAASAECETVEDIIRIVLKSFGNC